MIIDFHKYYGGGSGSEMTPEQVQEQINSALTPYWDSATTKSAIAEVATGISLVLEGYATSDDMQSAFTLISETQQAAEAGYNQLEARIDELSGSSPDLSGYYTSAQTENAIEEAIAGYSPDLSAYYTSAQTENAIQEALSGYSPDLSGYYTSAQTESAIEEAIAGVSVDLSAYWTSAQTQSAIKVVEDHLYDVEHVTASALTELHDGLVEVSGRTVDMSNYYTSTQVDNAIREATRDLATLPDVHYEITEATRDMVTSTYISSIWRGSQEEYDAIANKDPNTFYIIL